MGMMEDIKATITGIDEDGDGIISFDDLKRLASDHGIDSSKMDDFKADIVGPDGKLTVDDAVRLINEYMGNAGNFFNDLKSKFVDHK